MADFWSGFRAYGVLALIVVGVSLYVCFTVPLWLEFTQGASMRGK